MSLLFSQVANLVVIFVCGHASGDLIQAGSHLSMIFYDFLGLQDSFGLSTILKSSFLERTMIKTHKFGGGRLKRILLRLIFFLIFDKGFGALLMIVILDYV